MSHRILKQVAHTQAVSIFSSFIRFITFPVVVKQLSVAEYGFVSILLTIIHITSYIVGLNLYTYTRRHIPGKLEMEQYAYFKTQIVIEGSLFAIVTVAIFSLRIDSWLARALNITGYIKYLRFGFIYILFEVLYLECNRFMIAIKEIEIKNYAQLLTRPLFGLFVIGYWLFASKISLTAYVTALMVSTFTAIIYFAYHIKWNTFWTAPFLEVNTIGKAFKYAIPLLPATLFNWILDLSDRHFIAHLLNAKQVGIYGVGYNIFYLIEALLLSPIGLTIFPYATEAHNIGDVARKKLYFTRMLKYSLSTTLFFCIFVILAGEEIINLLSKPDYLVVVPILPLLSIFPIARIFLQVSSWELQLTDRTMVLSSIFGIAAVANLALNYILISAYGLMGAALATALSFGLAAAASWYVFLRRNGATFVDIRSARLGIIVLSSSCAFLLGYGISYLQNSAIQNYLVRVIILGGELFGIYTSILWFGKFFDDSEKQTIGRLSKRVFKYLSRT
jgi:O-antigen/teichoic acid export membrane protein